MPDLLTRTDRRPLLGAMVKDDWIKNDASIYATLVIAVPLPHIIVKVHEPILNHPATTTYTSHARSPNAYRAALIKMAWPSKDTKASILSPARIPRSSLVSSLR